MWYGTLNEERDSIMTDIWFNCQTCKEEKIARWVRMVNDETVFCCDDCRQFTIVKAEWKGTKV